MVFSPQVSVTFCNPVLPVDLQIFIEYVDKRMDLSGIQNMWKWMISYRCNARQMTCAKTRGYRYNQNAGVQIEGGGYGDPYSRLFRKRCSFFRAYYSLWEPFLGYILLSCMDSQTCFWESYDHFYATEEVIKDVTSHEGKSIEQNPEISGSKTIQPAMNYRLGHDQ